MTDSLHIACPHCGALNRLPESRLAEGGKCGKCHQALFAGQPVELTPANFQAHMNRSDLPLVVDFWAPWCGPCKMMAPMFAQAAVQAEPYVRLAKVDTESYPQLAAPYNIRSIPTMVMFRKGVEVARISGAMDARNILAWINQNR